MAKRTCPQFFYTWRYINYLCILTTEDPFRTMD